MIILGAAFHRQGGPDALNSYKLEFVVDESQRDGVLNLAKKLKKGSEVLLLIFDVEEEEQEIQELVTETPEQTRTRLNKRMHALIGNIAEERKLEKEKIKQALKEFLIKKKYMKISTKELDMKGLATAIYFLTNEFKDEKEEEYN